MWDNRLIEISKYNVSTQITHTNLTQYKYGKKFKLNCTKARALGGK